MCLIRRLFGGSHAKLVVEAGLPTKTFDIKYPKMTIGRTDDNDIVLVLAWRNELSMPVFQAVPGIRGMVSVHGVLNTVVVAPCFALAVSFHARPEG